MMMMMSQLRKFVPSRRMLSCLCAGLVGFILLEVFIFNIVIIRVGLALKDDLWSFASAKEDTVLGKLTHVQRFKDLVSVGRDGGFAKLLQETVGRVYIASSVQDTNFHQKFHISSLGIDVSHSGESVYLFKRIQSRQVFNYSNLVVDVGANDGLLSSNSYNFIHWGWSAILVEPQQYELNLAKLNNERQNDPYNEGLQKLTLVQAVLSREDGKVAFVTSEAVDKMESHIARASDTVGRPGKVTMVASMTVRTFARKYDIPQKFGILSLDAEGEGNLLLRQWIDLGYRPAYLIYESLHTTESIQSIHKYLLERGYRYLTKLGWNHIFEHKDTMTS